VRMFLLVVSRMQGKVNDGSKHPSRRVTKGY
jgi:hypothetical protein